MLALQDICHDWQLRNVIASNRHALAGDPQALVLQQQLEKRVLAELRPYRPLPNSRGPQTGCQVRDPIVPGLHWRLVGGLQVQMRRNLQRKDFMCLERLLTGFDFRAERVVQLAPAVPFLAPMSFLLDKVRAWLGEQPELPLGLPQHIRLNRLLTITLDHQAVLLVNLTTK